MTNHTDMGGLAKICKLYGSMTVQDADGISVEWKYDYALDKPRLEKDMTKEEIKASEKAKLGLFMKPRNEPDEDPRKELGDMNGGMASRLLN